MNRRRVLAAAGLSPMFVSVASASPATRAKPRPGDLLVHAFGGQAGQLIVPDEVGDERVFAFPRSSDGVVRDGSLHNQVSLLKLNEAAMTEKTRAFAAGPFVAVSAACTHAGCEISGWNSATAELECPCHGSRFDVLDAARVVNGPATKPLAYLPIGIENDGFRVTGVFSRRVGPPPSY
jgi:rieske iron-sulfur protein